MQKLPVLSSKEVVKLLTNKGFILVRQKGSHMRFKKKTDSGTLVTVVQKAKEIPKGTLTDILRQTKISREELFEFLKK